MIGCGEVMRARAIGVSSRIVSAAAPTTTHAPSASCRTATVVSRVPGLGETTTSPDRASPWRKSLSTRSVSKPSTSVANARTRSTGSS